MIQVHEIGYTYKDGSCALNNISLDLNKGNVIGLIGSNGAGKSTLFLNIMGILRPDRGKIHYKGAPIQYRKNFLQSYRNQVGIVFQNPDRQIFFSNVYDDIAFALRNANLDEHTIKERIQSVLSMMNLQAISNKPVHLLSYGQKKRVSIAGVLAMEGEVLLFDEPSAGLEPGMKQEMADIILTLRNKGKKIVVSSHDMDFIYRISDYIYLIHQGKNALEGPPHQVFSSEENIQSFGLDTPWLVKMHHYMGIPLFKTDQELLDYCKTNDFLLIDDKNRL
ncbi:MAG TPA: ABC transporter ATP-binding protein [Eubacteriaceae bacterium]|nr:ABC transporter ATP-binding protein [Eubacteriaceae bacterium]